MSSVSTHADYGDVFTAIATETLMNRHAADEECLFVTGMTIQEYERWMCGCPRCMPHVVPCENALCTQCRMDWFASWRESDA